MTKSELVETLAAAICVIVTLSCFIWFIPRANERASNRRECIAICKAKYSVPDGYAIVDGKCQCATPDGWKPASLPGE